MAADDSAVWVHNGDTGTLLRIDPKTNAVIATIPVGDGAGGVAIGNGAIWVAHTRQISRIDPQTNQIVATIALGWQDNADALAASAEAVWVTDYADDQLTRIDPHTNKVVATIPNQGGPSDVSIGAGAAWACNRHDPNGLNRVNLQSNQVDAQIAMLAANGQGLACTAVVALSHTIWTVDLTLGDGASVVLKRIDPSTNKVTATIPVPDTVPFHFAADDHSVWVWDPDKGLARVDTQKNQVVAALSMKGGAGVALGAGSVWFANASDGALVRITPAP
jgi:YVTN family beta-propeller protein